MSKFEVNKDTERRMVFMAGILWIGAGLVAFIAGRVANAFPAVYVLFPFVVGLLIVAWSWRMGEQAEERRGAEQDDATNDLLAELSDGEPQPA